MKPASIALAAAAVVAVACNASIRFDEGPADAGGLDVASGLDVAGGLDVAVDSSAPSCPSGTCGWETDDCDAGVCRRLRR